MKQYFSGVQLNFGTTISIWKNFDVFCQLGPSYIYANMYTYLGRYKFQGITPSGGAGIIYYLFKGGALLKDPRRRFPCLDSAHTKALYFLKPGGCRQEYDYRSTHGRYLMFSSEARMLVSGMGILAFSAAYPLLNRIHPFLALDLNAGFDRSTGDFGFDFLSTRAGARFIAAGTNRVQFVPSLSFGLGSITFQQQLRPVRTLTTFVADLSLLMRFRLSDFLWLETGMGQYSITPVKHGYSDFGSLYAQAGVGLRIHTRKKVKVSGTR